MVGDNGTIMQITQRRGQGRITRGFDFRVRLFGGCAVQRHFSVSLFVIRLGGGGLQDLEPVE